MLDVQTVSHVCARDLNKSPVLPKSIQQGDNAIQHGLVDLGQLESLLYFSTR